MVVLVILNVRDFSFLSQWSIIFVLFGTCICGKFDVDKHKKTIRLPMVGP